MPELRGTPVRGSNSVTFSGTAGHVTRVVEVGASFRSTGPQTGTLQLKEGSTVIWEAGVSGGLLVRFEPPWELSSGADATLALSGAYLTLVAAAEY